MLIYWFASRLNDVNMLALYLGGILIKSKSLSVSKLHQFHLVCFLFAQILGDSITKFLVGRTCNQNEIF